MDSHYHWEIAMEMVFEAFFVPEILDQIYPCKTQQSGVHNYTTENTWVIVK